jgi:hypothetical protein
MNSTGTPYYLNPVLLFQLLENLFKMSHESLPLSL